MVTTLWRDIKNILLKNGGEFKSVASFGFRNYTASSQHRSSALLLGTAPPSTSDLGYLRCALSPRLLVFLLIFLCFFLPFFFEINRLDPVHQVEFEMSGDRALNEVGFFFWCRDV